MVSLAVRVPIYFDDISKRLTLAYSSGYLTEEEFHEFVGAMNTIKKLVSIVKKQESTKEEGSINNGKRKYFKHDIKVRDSKKSPKGTRNS